MLWTLLSALAAAAVVVESLRRAVRRWSAWSDTQHFRAVAILALICLLAQWASLFAAS
jgi:predicted metal-dependent HD superfamily phosphohydrolase